MLYGPADWNEYYPNEDTIKFDISRDALFVMKDENGQLIAAISIDQDEDVDKLPCWNEALLPAGELSRLCVRKDMQCRGISKEMMKYAFQILKKQGKKSVHILVRTGHEVALSALILTTYISNLDPNHNTLLKILQLVYYCQLNRLLDFLLNNQIFLSL